MNMHHKQSSLPLGVMLFVTVLFAFASVEADEVKPHVVLVVGTHHYSPELSMPLFAKELERFGFRTTLVMGEGDPEKKAENVLPGIEALADADVAIWDPDREVVLHDAMMHDLTGYTPYAGRRLTGWPVTVLRRGEVIVADGVVKARPGSGQFLPRGGGAAAGVIPQLFGIGRRRKESNQRTEALASWAEMLRDARVDEYLQMHRQTIAGSPVALPGGAMRSVDLTVPQR